MVAASTFSSNPNVYQNLVVERDGPKAVLTFTREERLNALDARTFHELIAAADDLEADDAIQVVIVTGRGRGPYSQGPPRGSPVPRLSYPGSSPIALR